MAALRENRRGVRQTAVDIVANRFVTAPPLKTKNTPRHERRRPFRFSRKINGFDKNKNGSPPPP